MRIMLSGVAVLALACASASSALGQTTKTAKTACPASNPAVWWVPAANTYYSKGQAGYGKGAGQLVCRSAAVAKKAHAAAAKPMTGTMHGTTHAAPHPMTTSPGSMMGSPMPMPMTTGPMPGANPTATPAAEPGVSPMPGGPSPAPAAT